jgi:hypothetical protein
VNGHNAPYCTEENMMTKYLMLKHYRGAPAPANNVPMDEWTPEEVSAHVHYILDFGARLGGTGEFVDSQALSPEGQRSTPMPAPRTSSASRTARCTARLNGESKKVWNAQ